MASRQIQNTHRATTKLERMNLHKEKVEFHTQGEGLFRFRNRHNATLALPKPAADGTKVVGPRGEWEGDSYFLKMIPREATLVATLRHPQPPQMEDVVMEQKLILDQPDQVTTSGQIEHIMPTQPVVAPLNEQPGAPAPKPSERLLNEDPMDGVTILRD